MQYILVKGHVIEVNTYAIQLFHGVKCLIQRLDISHGVYPRVALMTIFAQHLVGII